MSFKSFLIEQEQLDEKLLVVGQGKKYNQIVFLAGGSGSGKDFVIHNFMEGEKFKVIDPDQLIELFLKVQKIKGGDFLNFSLKNPDDVTAIYDYVKNEKGWKSKKLELLFSDIREGQLPNIIFNTTLSWPNTLGEYVSKMEKLGYNKKDMHLVWVLSNYKIAVERNKTRSRIVDVEVVSDTHRGAASNMKNLLVNKSTSLNLDGGVYVILNNRENTIYWDKDKYPGVIKSFTYLTVKKPGQDMENEQQITNQLIKWISENTPEGEQLTESMKTVLKKKFGRDLTRKIPKLNKYQVLHSFKVNAPNITVDIIADIQDHFAEAIFKKNNVPFLAQIHVTSSNPEEWVSKLNRDKPFLDYLKLISRSLI